VRRGEIWTASRAGSQRLVVIVGHDAVTAQRSGVLVVPLSDVRASTIIEPTVSDEDGKPVGIAMVPRIGEIDKNYMSERQGRLDTASIEALEIALRAVLDM
jgi:mRNA-degrading endonuclease toxin of MazEF toxin-antitoxin module